MLSGSARIKVEDEIVELGEWDAIRFDKNTMRDVEAGRRASSTSPSVPATTPRTPRWSRLVGRLASGERAVGTLRQRILATS